ncbi:hypothetical protein MRY82_02835 [bacterium]|nr:hypothetical protein [bacterium]
MAKLDYDKPMNLLKNIFFGLFFLNVILTQAFAVPCSQGTFSADGHEPCTNCPVGTFASEEGATQCTPCSPGSFSSEEGQIECILCPIGRFQPDSGQSSCYGCAPGSFANFMGSITCTLCPEGYFQANSEAMLCYECEPGKVSLAGANACVDTLNASSCLDGQYESGMGCADCDPGTYAQAGDGFCRVCESGTFSDQPAASVCEECQKGTSSSFAIGRTDCTLCSAGTFAEDTGSPGCEDCPEGTKAAAGSSECVPIKSKKGGCQTSDGHILLVLLALVLFQYKQGLSLQVKKSN